MKSEIMKTSPADGQRFKIREQGWTKDVQKHGEFIYVVYNVPNIRKCCRKYLCAVIVLLLAGTFLSCTSTGNLIADRFFIPAVDRLFIRLEDFFYWLGYR